MIIMNAEKNENDKVDTFHISKPNFDISEVYKVKSFIRRHTTSTNETEEFKECRAKNHIPLVPVHVLLHHGRVFEIKTIRGMLYQMSVRIRDKYGDDIVYLLAPKFIDKENVCVTYVNAYKNKVLDESSDK